MNYVHARRSPAETELSALRIQNINQRRRITELEEELEAMKIIQAGAASSQSELSLYAPLNIEPKPLEFLILLMKHKIVSHDFAIASLYSQKDISADTSVIGVHILKIRRALKDYLITVHNKHGIGHFITSEDKAALRVRLEYA